MCRSLAGAGPIGFREGLRIWTKGLHWRRFMRALVAYAEIQPVFRGGSVAWMPV